MRLSLRQRPVLTGAALALVCSLSPLAARQATDKIDYDAIYRIKDEGFARSRVMELESWLTSVICHPPSSVCHPPSAILHLPSDIHA